MGKKSGSGIQDEQHGSYFLELRNYFFGLKFLNSLMLIRDPGWKKFRSGMGTKSDPGFGKNILDPQHCRYLNEIIVFYADLHPQLTY
jgi:hypothetical protein